ncbi:HupE/UreJ protein [Alteromonadaceae bacterium 2753L.S.0a.02]|nr:HupE/UreJ protein [Alteromonadaceae bacterium 2753L.S.0a.02]
MALLTKSIIQYVLHAFAIGLLLTSCLAQADDMRLAYLGIKQRTDDHTRFDVIFKVPFREPQIRFSENITFDAQTIVHKLKTSQEFTGNYYLDHWQIERAQGLAGMQLAIGDLASSSSEVLLRVEYLDGAVLTQRLTPTTPDFILPKKPTVLQTISTYFFLGITHILLGLDHLLFVLALILLLASRHKLIVTISGFTLAHSITLILASLNIIRVAIPPTEACIALSIVFIATEIVHVQRGRRSLTARYPWLVAFGFGLLHGLGFASSLGEIGLPKNAIVTALLVFNVGVEVGQLLFVSLVLGVRYGLASVIKSPPIWIQRVPAYFIGGVASFWMIQRIAAYYS